ncbi:MAG: ATP-binding cassette domain-containing protein [Spirochaetales bacterium]|nr:MAG: ATP-binding cassette domain-containing protein [Spirochaetales bacterium]
MNYVLEAKNITKDFPGVRALDNVSFDLQKGEIHALCGENGAGKTTFINVLSGRFPSAFYSGDIFIDGGKTVLNTVREAEKAGIAVIHQELNLYQDLSVTENIFIGHEIQKFGNMNWNAMYSETNEWLNKLQMENVRPTTKVKDLGIGKQQLIEIARILRLENIKIIILDEPTASLTEFEVELLLKLLRNLKKQDIASIYISHKIDEVMEIADRVTVFRDGQTVGCAEKADLTKKEIVRLMVGREIKELFPKIECEKGETVLEVKNFSVVNPSTSKYIVKDAGFHVKRGEILGIFGLIGAGRTELMSSIFGNKMGTVSGDIYIAGSKKTINSPGAGLKEGIAYVTEDRKGLGIIHTMNVKENTSLSHLEHFSSFLAIDENREVHSVLKSVQALNVKMSSLDAKIINLSGGNQQKVLLARSLMKGVSVLILDEPTRGIDVGAKHEIYQIMGSLVQSGVAIIMVSSELPEILGMCDRILVMCRGVITGEFDNREKIITQEEIMICATGTGIEANEK